MSASVAPRAMELALAGRAAEGAALLSDARSRGDWPALLLHALWLIEGRFVPRDLARARLLLRLAADGGHAPAARILGAMLACGIGGAADWAGSLALLRQWSSRDRMAARQIELIEAMRLDDHGRSRAVPGPAIVSTDPRIERIGGLFTAAECDFLAALADPRAKPARIFDDEAQQFVHDPVRRSDHAGFPVIQEWPFIRAINLRIAAATGTEVGQGEPLQVLRYGPGQEYRPHFDAVAGMANPRILTAIAWLNADFRGGETVFPELGLSFAPRRGDLLLFANTLAGGEPDRRTRHAGASVTAGTKYLLSRWIRMRPSGEEGFGRHEVERGSTEQQHP